MQVIDLSHPIAAEMPVYPGTLSPEISHGSTFNEDGFLEQKITMVTHTGTHLDAPAHIIENGRTLDRFPVDYFCGRGVCIPMGNTESNTIGLNDLVQHEHRIAAGCDFVLLNTGQSRWWGHQRYFEDYPTLSVDAAKWLARFPLKGFGVDAISVDPIFAENWPVHNIFLKKEIILIENLTNLKSLPDAPFIFSCLPLKITNADGSPVRAVAAL
jgi:arylformamidase